MRRTGLIDGCSRVILVQKVSRSKTDTIRSTVMDRRVRRRDVQETSTDAGEF